MADFETALQRNQRAQRELSEGMLVRDSREMRRSIDFPATHTAPVADGMPAHVAEIPPADSPQQIEIHHDSRLLADNLDFVIFLSRQAFQPLALDRARFIGPAEDDDNYILTPAPPVRKCHAMTIVLRVRFATITRTYR